MKCLLTLLYSLIALVGSAQVINGYAEVTGIAGSVLTLGTVDEGGDTFEDDEWVVIMQMQDDVIGVTGNNVNFGDMGDIENAGDIRNPSDSITYRDGRGSNNNNTTKQSQLHL
jgi:hypothetical protein